MVDDRVAEGSWGWTWQDHSRLHPEMWSSDFPWASCKPSLFCVHALALPQSTVGNRVPVPAPNLPLSGRQVTLSNFFFFTSLISSFLSYKIRVTIMVPHCKKVNEPLCAKGLARHCIRAHYEGYKLLAK